MLARTGSISEPFSGRSWDPATIEREVGRRILHYAALGVARGDRVLLHHGNTLEFFGDLLAMWHLGACAIPLDGRLTAFEIETIAQAFEPRLAIWRESPDRALAARLAALGTAVVETPGERSGLALDFRSTLPESTLALDDPALILLTSGTTGQPKGVVHTHRSLAARWMGLGQRLDPTPFRRTLCLLPTHFGHGLICNCLFPWLAGQDLFLLPPFRPEVLVDLGRIVDEYRITFLSSVPALWRVALKTAAPPTARSLVWLFCGSAPLSAALWSDVRSWSGGAKVTNAYGITETGSWVAGSAMLDVAPADGLIGEPWGASIRVLRAGAAETCVPGEPGQVWIRTPALMQGYFRRPDLTREAVHDGWFHTGDIGLYDERGLLFLRGRAREEINKGGMKVYPADVDAVVERCPGVRDVCTFAYEDSVLGEDIGIAVVLEGDADAGLASLHAWTTKHLATHQQPRRWYVVDEIPRSSRGKVNRAAVAQTCSGRTPLRLRELVRGPRA
jgi:acyl-CoA synthetase (AMP-forming)/AMP-acid ligase II